MQYVGGVDLKDLVKSLKYKLLLPGMGGKGV
jgi:hypothetical protein